LVATFSEHISPFRNYTILCATFYPACAKQFNLQNGISWFEKSNWGRNRIHSSKV